VKIAKLRLRETLQSLRLGTDHRSRNALSGNKRKEKCNVLRASVKDFSSAFRLEEIVHVICVDGRSSL